MLLFNCDTVAEINVSIGINDTISQLDKIIYKYNFFTEVLFNF